MFKFFKDRYAKKRFNLILADGIFDFILKIDVRTGTYLRKYGKNNLPYSLQKRGKYDDLVKSLSGRLYGGAAEDFSRSMKLIRILSALAVQRQYVVFCKLSAGETIRYKKIWFFNNAPEEIVLLCEDVTDVREYQETEQKKIESEMRRRREELQSLQSRMVYLAHEIRSPLNSIYGNLDILQMEAYEKNRYLDNAILSAEYLLRLINGVLHISKTENGDSVRSVEAVTLEELVKCPEGMFEYEAKKKNITLCFQFGEPVYRYLYLDREAIQQILVNLISNAVKYSTEGGKICCRIVERYVEEKRVRLFLEVADMGIGMEEEFLLKNFSGVWEEYAREGRMEGAQGSGLGLFLTKRLVELLHGSIRIESRAGVGTKVSVELETDADDVLYDTHGFCRKDNEQIVKGEIYRIKRALVAEDEDASMDVLCAYLEKLGIAADQTYDGEEVVAVFEQSAENYYDIIFMDRNMPAKNGVEAIRAIRRMERKDSGLPIIVMTAEMPEQQKTDDASVEINDYLIKPYCLEDIRATLSKYPGG